MLYGVTTAKENVLKKVNLSNIKLVVWKKPKKNNCNKAGKINYLQKIIYKILKKRKKIIYNIEK